MNLKKSSMFANSNNTDIRTNLIHLEAGTDFFTYLIVKFKFFPQFPSINYVKNGNFDETLVTKFVSFK